MESKIQHGGTATEAQRPRPDLQNPLLAPFWEGAREHKLLLRRCDGCGTYQWPARPMCAQCYGTDFSWVEGVGRGQVYTYAVIRRAFHPAFKALLPYILVTVEVAPGVRMLGNLLHTEPEEVEAEMRVSAEFLDQPDGVTLICWSPENG